MRLNFNQFFANTILTTVLAFLIMPSLNVFGECTLVELESKMEVVCENEAITKNEVPERSPQKIDAGSLSTNTGSNFITDNAWFIADLGAFESFAINNYTQIAGEVSSNKSIVACVWKKGFLEKLDDPVVTSRSSALAINDSGQVVGYQTNLFEKNERAVLWDNGILKELRNFDVQKSRAIAINDVGEVVGWANDINGSKYAFIWRNGGMVPMGMLASAIAINKSGQVLGVRGKGKVEYVLYDAHNIQAFDKPSKQDITSLETVQELKFIPTCLNDAGQVAGYNEDKSIIFSNSEIHELDKNFVPLGINKHGIIVGKSIIRNTSEAVVWKDGQLTVLSRYFKNLGGWITTEARGINDYGQIIVHASHGKSSTSRTFLISPKSNIPILITGNNIEDINMIITGNSKENANVGTYNSKKSSELQSMPKELPSKMK